MFAGLGLVLALLGVHGVMANLVSQRTREIGIRFALGARYRQVIGMVLRSAAQLLAIGVVVPSQPFSFLQITFADCAGNQTIDSRCERLGGAFALTAALSEPGEQPSDIPHVLSRDYLPQFLDCEVGILGDLQHT